MSILADVLSINKRRRQRAAVIWHEFARVLQIWMEATWMILWVWAILNLRLNLAYWPLLGIFGGIMTVSYYIAVAIQQIKTKKWISRLVYIVWVLIAIWVTVILAAPVKGFFNLLSPIIDSVNFVYSQNDIPIQVWLATTAGLVILRSLKLSQFHVSSHSVRNSFQIGLVFMLFFGLFGINRQIPVPFFPSILFLGLSLIGLSSARLAEMSRQRGGSRINLKPFWLVLIVSATATILLLGSLLVSVMRWQIAGITDASVFILAILTTLIIVPFALIALILTALLIPFIRFLTSIGFFQLFKLDPGSLGIESNLQPIQGLQRQLPIAPVFVLIGLVALLTIIGYLIGRIRRRSLTSLVGENHQEDEQFMDGFKKKGWLRGKIRAAFDQLGLHMKLINPRKVWAAARIRHAYAQFLDSMNRLGYEREQSQTPLEFQPVAAGIMPEMQTEIEIITRAYLLVRYGEIPENEVEVQKVLAAWGKIHLAAKPLIDQKQKSDRKANPDLRQQKMP